MRFIPALAVLLLCLPLSLSWSQQLSCKPCSHAFGKVKVGTSASFSIQLSNTGSKSLRIFSKAKQGSGEFHLGSFPLPITLQPGKAVKLPIIFKPTTIGRVTGSFTLSSNALDPVLALPVAGADKDIQIWDPTSGQTLVTIKTYVTGVAAQEPETYLPSGSAGTVDWR